MYGKWHWSGSDKFPCLKSSNVVGHTWPDLGCRGSIGFVYLVLFDILHAVREAEKVFPSLLKQSTSIVLGRLMAKGGPSLLCHEVSESSKLSLQESLPMHRKSAAG